MDMLKNMTTKVAVVTGANKGIGFEIVRELCQQFEGDVILTARDNSRGQAAVHLLEKEGLYPIYHQLDISDHDSIVTLKSFLQKTYGGLDCLVNNAGILYESELFGEIFPGKSPINQVPPFDVAENTCKVNFFATLDVCEILFPLLRPYSRVCNISSDRSKKALLQTSQFWKNRLLSPDISMDDLRKIMQLYLKAAKENKRLEEGFTCFSYGMSKLAMNIMTEIQQREMDQSGAHNILINSCAPGFVATDMTQHQGHLTVVEGAVTPLYLALIPPNVTEPRGKFLTKSMSAVDIKEC